MSDLTDMKLEYVLVVTIHIQNPNMRFVIEVQEYLHFVNENRHTEPLNFDKANTETIFFYL